MAQVVVTVTNNHAERPASLLMDDGDDMIVTLQAMAARGDLKSVEVEPFKPVTKKVGHDRVSSGNRG